MTRTHNEFFKKRNANLYADKDSNFNFSRDSSRKNAIDPYSYAKLNSSACSFIADWQLPKKEMTGVDKPVC